MSNPLIQIGDEIREMTDEEFIEYTKLAEGYVFPYPDTDPA